MGGDGGIMGGLFGEKGKTSVTSANPEWLDQNAEWATKGMQSAQGKFEGMPDFPAGNMINPYANFNSLFSNKTGEDYLSSFSQAPKQAYNQALTDTKNVFGAKGMYGSVGNPAMSGAMASAGQNYAASMADAQQKAQAAQANDFLMQAKSPEWQNQLQVETYQANLAKQQQVIQNYLAAMGISVPALMQGQMVQQSGGQPGAFGTLMSGAGAMGGAGMGAMSKGMGFMGK